MVKSVLIMMVILKMTMIMMMIMMIVDVIVGKMCPNNDGIIEHENDDIYEDD